MEPYCNVLNRSLVFAADYISAEAAKILRLLHIQELRELQTKINEAIVQVQALTANPKTDARLGKVGIGDIPRRWLKMWYHGRTY